MLGYCQRQKSQASAAGLLPEGRNSRQLPFPSPAEMMLLHQTRAEETGYVLGGPEGMPRRRKPEKPKPPHQTPSKKPGYVHRPRALDLSSS